MNFKLLSILIFIFGLGIGFAGGYFMPKEIMDKDLSFDIDRVIEDIHSSGLLVNGATSYPLTQVFGDVFSLGENEFEVNIDPPSLRSIIKGDNDVRVVVYDNNTEFVRRVSKSEEQIAQEQEAFFESSDNLSGIGNDTLPPTFSEVSIGFSDIKVGDKIIVVTENEILDRKEFTATQAIVL